MKKITIDDKGLEALFVEIYNGTLEDLEEASDWREAVYDKLSNRASGIEQYGELYNMALQAKGAARDRLLKLANQIRDRVKSKEGNPDATGLDTIYKFMTPEKIQETILNEKQKLREQAKAQKSVENNSKK